MGVISQFLSVARIKVPKIVFNFFLLEVLQLTYFSPTRVYNGEEGILLDKKSRQEW